MALWGNSDNVGSAGTVSLNYGTLVVTGTGTRFGLDSTDPAVGDVIRFGDGTTNDYGDAVIVAIASSESLTIGSTQGLSGDALAGVEYRVSELPVYTVADESYSERNTDFDKQVYAVTEAGLESADGGQYDAAHAGWVGVTTYMDNHGNLRVKSEVLVSASGITTGNPPLYPPA